MTPMMSLHVVAGTAAVLAGTIALGAAKGSVAHRRAGRIFCYSMLGSAGPGALLGLINYEDLLITFYAGIFACYLVASGWATLRRSAWLVRWFEAGGLALALAITAGLLLTGFAAMGSPTGRAYGFAADDYFLLSIMAGVAAAGDLNMLLRAELGAHQRIARHVWRMGLGLFIAAGSLFTGPGAQAFPAALRQSGLLALPELLIALLLGYWLVKLRWGAGLAGGRAASGAK
ncbi:MAG: hypothetical protein ABIU18_03175 [Novosphingobium sp.]